jgi:hypothetical protein
VRRVVPQHTAALLHSATFQYFLSELPGIWNLLPDTYLQRGGYHVMPPGGHLDVHAGRNTHYMTGLTRRLTQDSEIRGAAPDKPA